MAEARTALDGFDYEEAETRFREALLLSQGAATPAAALLQLLVGTLALDDNALTLAEDLPAETVAHPSVRKWLALAAARQGQADRALDWIEGLEGAAAQEVFLALTELAIRQERLADARKHLDAARATGAITSRVLKLEDRFVEACSAGLKPAEARARSALEAGRLEEAEQEARAILEVWPGSETARHVIRTVAAARKRARIEALLSEARAAEQEGALARALDRYQEARRLGAPPDQVDGPAERIARALEQERLKHEVAETAAILQQALDPVGLRRYASLPGDARRRVRDLAQIPALEWLDQVLADQVVSPREAAEAVLALADAVAAERRGEDPEAILEALGRHESVIGGLEVCREMVARARHALTSYRQARAAELLDAVTDLLDQDELPQAEARWARLNPDWLAPLDRPRHEALARRIAEQRNLRRLEEALDAALLKHEWIDAKSIAAQLVLRSSGPARNRWTEKLEELEQALKQHWQITAIASPGPDLALTDVDLRQGSIHHAAACLADQGRVVIVSAHGVHLFLRVLEPASGHVTRALAMAVPSPLHGNLEATVDQDTLWVSGGDGQVVALRTSDWSLIAGKQLDARRASGEVVTAVHVVPGAPFVWYRVRDARGGSRLVVVNREARFEPVRVLEGAWSCHLATPGPTGAQALLVWSRGGAAWYDPTGEPMAGQGQAALPGSLWQASPGGEPGSVAMVLVSGDEEPGQKRWSLVSAHPERGVFPPGDGELWDRVRPVALAGAPRHGLVLLLCKTWQHRFRLRAYRMNARLEQVWEVHVPPGCGLVRGEDGRVLAVAPGPGGPRFYEVGEEPPVIGEPPRWLQTGLPALDDVAECLLRIDPPADDLLSSVRSFTGPPEARASWLPDLRKLATGNAERLLQIARALWWLEQPEASLDLVSWTREFHPEAPDFALERASQHAGQGRWGDVRRILGSLDPDALVFYSPGHVHHLAGLAHVQKNRLENARDAWKQGEGIRGRLCDLEGLYWMVASDSPALDTVWDRRAHAAAALRDALERADGAVEAREWTRVIDILDHPVVWREMEPHTLARLAEAWLRHREDTRETAYRKRIALAAFVARQQALDRGESPGPEFLLSRVHWRRRRLADIARRATSWLERQGR